MTRQPTFVTITLLAGGLALGGSALANDLENPGAETGDLTGWTASDGVSASPATESFMPLAGDWLFLMAGVDAVIPVGAHTETLEQAVDVAECSNEFLSGEFSASGWAATEGDHFGTAAIDFGDGPVIVVDDIQSPSPDEWIEFGPVSGLVPEAESAVYTVSGSKIDADELETTLQVAYDDLDFTLNCLRDFAKVSGRIGQFGRGNAPEVTFDGAVGTLDDGTPAAGAIEINYRALGSVCTFTASEEIVYTTADSATINADYECVGGEKDEQTGVAAIDLTAKDASGCTAHANKDRGSIAVTADDPDLDISGEFGTTGAESCIDRGNVEIDDGGANDVVEEEA